MYYYNNRIYEGETASVEDEVNKFLKRYEATGELSRHRTYARLEPMRYKDWLANGTPIPFEQTLNREPMVEINMPKHRFQELVERERWYGNLEGEVEYYKRIVKEMQRESALRQNNPALSKAWDNYQLLLKIVDNG